MPVSEVDDVARDEADPSVDDQTVQSAADESEERDRRVRGRSRRDECPRLTARDGRRDRRRRGEDAADLDEADDPLEEFRQKLLTLPGVVRGPHLLGHGEPGEGEPGEPDLLAEHGGLHLPGRGAAGGGLGDQERPAPKGSPDGSPRLHPGADGAQRRELVGGPEHAGGHRLRRARHLAGAADPRRGRADARADHRAATAGRRRRSADDLGRQQAPQVLDFTVGGSAMFTDGQSAHAARPRSPRSAPTHPDQGASWRSRPGRPVNLAFNRISKVSRCLRPPEQASRLLGRAPDSQRPHTTALTSAIRRAPTEQRGGHARQEESRPLVKVQLNAGAATPAPPVGTALGPHGVNIMEFCKAYNAATEQLRGTIVRSRSRSSRTTASPSSPRPPPQQR